MSVEPHRMNSKRKQRVRKCRLRDSLATHQQECVNVPSSVSYDFVMRDGGSMSRFFVPVHARTFLRFGHTPRRLADAA
jgi:hypothetical protein